MNPIKSKTGKVSPLFLVAITFVLTAGVAASIYISSLKTPLEIRQERNAFDDKIAAAEAFQTYGTSLQEYKNKVKINGDNIIHMREIDTAIINHDIDLLKHLFNKKPKFDFNKYKPNLYKYTAINGNKNIFLFFLNQGVDCNYNSVVGQRAFEQLLSIKDVNYLNMLIEYGCDIGIHSNSSKIISVLANSEQFRKVLLFPLNKKNEMYYQIAFERAVQNKSTETAIEILNKGLETNFMTKYESRRLSALGLSLLFKQTEVALALLNKGAKSINNYGDYYTKFELVSAIRHEQIEVAKVILDKDPDYIVRENIGNLYVESALNTYHKENHTAALKLAFDNGLTSKDLDLNGVKLLMDASRNSNYEIVKLLLDSGIDPNKPINMKTVLGTAQLSNFKNAGKVVALLKERGVTFNPKCKIGTTVSLTKLEDAYGNLSENQLKKISEKPLEFCYGIVTLCVDVGIGTDDCVASIKQCENISEYFSNKNVNLCCSSKVKAKYTEARCSGLKVSESFNWVAKQL